MFNSLGASYEERATNDAGKHMQTMAAGLGSLSTWAPSLTGPLPPVGTPEPPLEASVSQVLGGKALASLTEARTAVNRHWSEAMAFASEAMQASLEKVALAMSPSWKENLEPSATWQMLVDSCGDTLCGLDCEAIMTNVNMARKARPGISQTPVPAKHLC